MQYSKNVLSIIEGMSIKYNNMVYELSEKGRDIIKLSYGEAYFNIPLHEFGDLPFPNIYHYSHSRGINDLREKLCRHYREEYEVDVRPEDEIIITTGAKSAIFISLLSILDSGDEVIVWEPQWVSYTEMVKLCNAVPVTVPYTEGVKDFEKYVTPKTKCIILCNPNNPRGNNHSYEEVQHLLDLCRERNIYLLSDESYSDFMGTDEQFISLGRIDKEFKYSIITNSISKNLGISGWRIGYVIANRDLINQIIKVQQHLVTCPPTILELYLAKHFEEIMSICRPQVKNVVTFRNKVRNYLKQTGIDHLEGNSTFYLFASIAPSKLHSEEFATKLLYEKNVSTVPGAGYGRSCDKFVRISVGVEPWERVVEGINRMKQLIEETR